MHYIEPYKGRNSNVIGIIRSTAVRKTFVINNLLKKVETWISFWEVASKRDWAVRPQRTTNIQTDFGVLKFLQLWLKQNNDNDNVDNNNNKNTNTNLIFFFHTWLFYFKSHPASLSKPRPGSPRAPPGAEYPRGVLLPRPRWFTWTWIKAPRGTRGTSGDLSRDHCPGNQTLKPNPNLYLKPPLAPLTPLNIRPLRGGAALSSDLQKTLQQTA